MGNENFNPLESLSKRKYETLLSEINTLLSHLPAMSDDDKKDKTFLDQFPEKNFDTPKEFVEYFKSNIKKWLLMYDRNVLGVYEQKIADECHDSKICLPCHLGVPRNFPLYVQYLYSLQEPEKLVPGSVREFQDKISPIQDRTIPYQEIVEGAKKLEGSDKTKFLYELRLGFLKAVSEGVYEYEILKKMIDDGPEKYYEQVLNVDEEDDENAKQETRELYDKLVATAQKNDIHDFGSDTDLDYVLELGQKTDETMHYFFVALRHLKLIKDLILEKNK